MNKQRITDISNTLYRKVKHYGGKAMEDFNAVSIHKFRIAYKKLRAFFRMLSQGKEAKNQIKISRPLKDTYAVAGSLRDLQLQQQRLRKVPGQRISQPLPGDHLPRLKIYSLKIKLLKAMSKNPVPVSKKHTTALLPDKYPLRSFEIFIQGKKDSITAGGAKKKLSDSQLHSIRKDMKDLFYTLQLYKGADYKKLSRIIYKEHNKKNYTELMTELGKFQDQCTAITLLKKDGSKQQAVIRNQWIKEKEARKKMLIKKLKPWAKT